jgi:TRAP-type uncharacterized transport system fused permease subunit
VAERPGADHDVFLAGLAIAGPLYFNFNFHAMVMRAGAETTLDLAMGLLTIAFLLEATRRAIGPVLPLIAIAFMLYAYAGPYMPELIAHRGYSPERIIRHLYPTTEGIFGIPLAVASTFVFLFVLFGAVMQRTGISDYLTGVAMSGLGSYTGGPAKAAVLASALMGSFSGSSTANVATTGTLTIPLMKRVGFRPETAGGVETAASTTGQFVPPVMGAAAFVMVEMTGIPYVEIIQAALLPAILDLAGVVFCVHMHALKMKISGCRAPSCRRSCRCCSARSICSSRSSGWSSCWWWHATPRPCRRSGPSRWRSLSRWWRATPSSCGARQAPSCAAAILSRASRRASRVSARSRRGRQSGCRPERTGPPASEPGSWIISKAWVDWGKDVLWALADGARQAIPISVACATAGIIIGIITLTGLGLSMQSILLVLSGGELWAALIFTAIGSIILGLGVPTTANYIIMATLMAPALVQLGVPLLAAHLFVFYFGILADTTPPVGLGAYVAAGIARAGPIRTAMEGFKFSLTAFIIPFMFVYNPMLILLGEIRIIELGWTVISGLIGVYALSVMKEGWWRTRANVIERIAMTFAAILLIQPSVLVDVAGFGIMAIVFGWQTFKLRREARSGARKPGVLERALGGARDRRRAGCGRVVVPSGRRRR